MNRLREFIGSSSGLAPMRQGLGLGWVISALVGLAVLLGASEAAEADKCEYRTYDDCGYNAWCASRNENTPIRCRTTHVDCSFDYYCISRSEAEQAGAFLDPTSKTECSYHDGCAEFYSAEPYRYCTTYYDENGNVYWEDCECSSTPCSEAEQATPTAVLTPAAVVRPVQHRLGDAYPNPFNPAMVIPLDLATDQKQVHLALYDVLGRRVRQLWDGSLRAGSHRFVWDGRDEAGKGVAAGVYIYKKPS